MIFSPRDVVVIPYPYQEREGAKRRPALVLSTQHFHQTTGAFVGAMITTASATQWELDVQIEHLEASGLKSPSVVRPKLFTLDTSLIIKKIGAMQEQDMARVGSVLHHCIPSVNP